MKLEKRFQSIILYFQQQTKSRWMTVFFLFLLLTILIKLFRLQIINGAYYARELLDQHYSQSILEAKRGNIYVVDRSQKKMQLTQNIKVYNLFVDPNFLPDKQRFIQDFSPILYEHFCELYGMQKPSVLECIQHIQQFIGRPLLPDRTIKFYGNEQLS
jgi:cell division protein FtsI/penicillin-binding protein 2